MEISLKIGKCCKWWKGKRNERQAETWKSVRFGQIFILTKCCLSFSSLLCMYHDVAPSLPASFSPSSRLAMVRPMQLKQMAACTRRLVSIMLFVGEKEGPDKQKTRR